MKQDYSRLKTYYPNTWNAVTGAKDEKSGEIGAFFFDPEVYEKKGKIIAITQVYPDYFALFTSKEYRDSAENA